MPTSTTRTGDGRWVIIGGNGDSVYSRLMAAVGHPEMGSDNPKFANNTKRCAAEAEIYKVKTLNKCWLKTASRWTSSTLRQLDYLTVVHGCRLVDRCW